MIFYVRFKADRLRVNLVGARAEYNDVPVVALSEAERRVVGIGAGARNARGVGVVVSNGFDHDRLVIGDVHIADLALRHAFRQVHLQWRAQRTWWRPLLKPDVIMHPLAAPCGDLTSFEREGLKAMAFRSGARRVVVWCGRELSEQEIRRGDHGPWEQPYS